MANKSYKGRRFEIWVAGRLSEWWTGGKRDDLLWHTHDSGGRATRRTKKGKTTKGLYGDIVATDPEIIPLTDLFVIECKNGYNAHTFAHILDCPKGAAKPIYLEWFEKAEKTKEESDAYSWWLIVKRDRREPLIFMPEVTMRELYDNENWPNPFASLDCLFAKKWRRIAGTHLSVFLDEIGSSVIKDLHGYWRRG